MRRIVILVVGLLAITSHCEGAVAYVQSKLNFGNAATSITIQFTSAPTAGNLIAVAAGHWNSPGSDLTISDNCSNTYTQLVQSLQSSTGLELNYVANAAACSPHIVTIATGGGSKDLIGVIFEVSGAATASPADGSNSGAGTGTAFSSGSVTPSGNSIYIGATVWQSTSANISMDSPWTQDEYNNGSGSGNTPMNAGHQTGSGAKTAQWTSNTSVTWNAVLGVFKEAAAGGAGGPPLMLLGVGR